MLVAIKSPHGYLKYILEQVQVLHNISFVDAAHDIKSIVIILDDEYDYKICADDKEISVKKPAKVEALSRAILIALNDSCYNFKAASFYPWRRTLVTKESALTLTEKESEVLHHLLAAFPNPVNKKDLLKEIWGYSEESETSTVEAHIYRLRGKLSSLNLDDVIVTSDNSYAMKI